MIIVILLGMAVVIVVVAFAGMAVSGYVVETVWPILWPLLQWPLAIGGIFVGLFVFGTSCYVLAFKLPYWIFLKLRCAIRFFQKLPYWIFLKLRCAIRFFQRLRKRWR